MKSNTNRILKSLKSNGIPAPPLPFPKGPINPKSGYRKVSFDSLQIDKEYLVKVRTTFYSDDVVRILDKTDTTVDVSILYSRRIVGNTRWYLPENSYGQTFSKEEIDAPPNALDFVHFYEMIPSKVGGSRKRVRQSKKGIRSISKKNRNSN
jgi:hypothetical protein